MLIIEINELTVAKNIVATLNQTHQWPKLATNNLPGESMGTELLKIITTDDPHWTNFGIVVGYNDVAKQISITVKNQTAISTTILNPAEIHQRWNQWPVKISID